VSARRGRLLVALAIVTVAVACRSHHTTDSPPAGARAAAEQPIALPDISRVDAAVQTQLREQHVKMTTAVASASGSPAERAAAYGEMGKLFIATEFYDAAERALQNARLLAPSDMRWPYYLGHVARLSNNPSRAVGLFEQTLGLQADHVPSLVWLAEMLLAQNQPARARPLLERARALAPREAAVLYGLGRVALEDRDFAGAVKELEAALAIVPSASRVRYPLAMAYRGLGDASKAEAQLRQRGEVDLPPADGLMGEIGGLLRNAEAFETRGTQAIDARSWPEAVRELRQAIAIAPNNGFTRLNLGTALYMTGDATGALEQYQAAVRLRPDLAKAHFAIGVLKETAGDDAAALDAFGAAVKADPASSEARQSLADALRRNGRVEEALPHYTEVLRANPSASQASFGYAVGLVRLRRYAEARDRLADAARVYPDQPGFAHALARLLASAPDDRVRDGQRALAIMKDLLKSQNTLGTAETMAMVFAELGEWMQAVDWQRQTIDAARQAKQPALVARLTANLRLYEQRKPCRVPWADDDPVHRPGAQ
jgi:tetratricopeptide (TPR) repeat protein